MRRPLPNAGVGEGNRTGRLRLLFSTLEDCGIGHEWVTVWRETAILDGYSGLIEIKHLGSQDMR